MISRLAGGQINFERLFFCPIAQFKPPLPPPSAPRACSPEKNSPRQNFPRLVWLAPTMSEITLMLQAIGRGESRTLEQLLPLVYDELRQMAAVRMARESAGHTLQPTALVHEAWLRLVG